MALKLTFRQLLLSILALWYELSQKEIAAVLGMKPKGVSKQLTHERKSELRDDFYEKVLKAMNARPAAVRIVTACIEGLEALDQVRGLSEEVLAEIEATIATFVRQLRTYLIEAARRARPVSDEGYPDPAEVSAARFQAEELVARLKFLSPRNRTLVVRMGREYQSWAVLEKVCKLSEDAASSDLEEAFAWVRLARKIAARVRGPEGWLKCLKGYAEAFFANVLRVSGDLKRAEAIFEEAKKLWAAGSDPLGILDPGVILDLEASLLRALRRIDEALDRLKVAEKVGWRRERALIKKGCILEVMGEYEQALEPFLEAGLLVDRATDPRLWYQQRFNLAVTLTHLGRSAEASKLIEDVRGVATELGDKIFLCRVPWLEGCILAGLGRLREARGKLEQSRRGFEARGMGYDVALALLEEFVLLLDEGKTAEVKALAPALAKVFDSKGVHREALAALQLFQEAIEQEVATADLARRVLRFLSRAQHDQSLRFES